MEGQVIYPKGPKGDKGDPGPAGKDGSGGGGTPASSVVAETSFGQASAVGVGTNYAREDHTHGTMAAPTSVTGNAGTATALQTPRAVNGVAFDGTADITVTAAGSTLTGSSIAAGMLGSTGTTACAGNDSRLSDARTPTAHATSHKNGGSDEVATATAGANAIPKAGAGGTLAIGWIPTGSTSSTACIGNDSRLSDSRTPTGSAGGSVGGTYPTSLTCAGRYLATTVKTSTTSFTTGFSTHTIFVRLAGAGGGGGGCTSVASAAGAAGGGGAGGYAEKTFTVTPSTAYTIQVGAKGSGSSGAGGGNGTASTFQVGATTVTANGGTGGPVATAATTLTARAGGAGGVVSTNGDVNGAGMPGQYGVVLIVATPIVASGSGGSGPFGAGGLGLVAVGNGNAAAGFGAGGGGAATGASTVRTGGDGTAGVIVIDEYE